MSRVNLEGLFAAWTRQDQEQKRMAASQEPDPDGEEYQRQCEQITQDRELRELVRELAPRPGIDY